MARSCQCWCVAGLWEHVKGLLSRDAPDEEICAVLQTIKAAQDDGLAVYGKDGNLTRRCPGHAVARAEIEQGAKKSHWIWYVWPSLQSVRSNVRYPQFLLPNLQAARAYLCHPVLAERLVDVSRLAAAHLDRGVPPQKLFGKQHKFDIAKFREAMTVFAVAARLNHNKHQESIFLAGLHALGATGLDDHALHVLSQSTVPAEAMATANVAATFNRSDIG